MRRTALAFMMATAGTAAMAATAEAATLGLEASPCQISGEKVNLLGGGYTPNSYVNVALDGRSLGDLPTDASGVIAGTLTPQGLKGVKTHSLVATDTANAALTATYSFLGTTRQVTVKPKHARAGKKLKLNGYGFLKGGKAYIHVRGHGYSADAKVGKPKGACGTWSARRHVVPSTAAAGSYSVQFDQKKRFSRKTKPRVRGTMTVTRTFSSLGAPASGFAGARPIYTWTKVD
jgi:hypothetical protein